MWPTIITIVVIVVILSIAIVKIVHDKRNGVKCIGCPMAEQCSKYEKASCTERDTDIK